MIETLEGQHPSRVIGALHFPNNLFHRINRKIESKQSELSVLSERKCVNNQEEVVEMEPNKTKKRKNKKKAKKNK